MQKCLSGDAFNFQGEGKLTLGGGSVAINPCTLLNGTQWTAEILFLKDIRLQHFNAFLKYLFFCIKQISEF